MAQPATPLPTPLPLPAPLVDLLQGATVEQRAALAQALLSPELSIELRRAALAGQEGERLGATSREAFKRRLRELAAQIEGVTALYLSPDLRDVFFAGPTYARSVVDRCYAAAVQVQNELAPGQPHRMIPMFTNRGTEGLIEQGFERVELRP